MTFKALKSSDFSPSAPTYPVQKLITVDWQVKRSCSGRRGTRRRRDTAPAMSQENLDLVKALIPQGTDIVPLFRDEATFARIREAIGPLLTDDFQNVVVLLLRSGRLQARKASATTGSTGSSRGRRTESPSMS